MSISFSFILQDDEAEALLDLVNEELVRFEIYNGKDSPHANYLRNLKQKILDGQTRVEQEDDCDDRDEQTETY